MRRWVGVLAGIVTCVLIVSLLPLAPATTAARAAAAAAPSGAAAKPAVAPPSEEVAALRQARKSGHRVEVTGRRSETTTVWANPDGSLTRKMAAVPERWRDGQGGWHDLDLTPGRRC